MPEEALNTTVAPGWFGKLPSLGDFASRRLPAAFVQPWDRWLQRSMLAARGQLGECWLDTYLVAPVLRFWLAPGVLSAPRPAEAGRPPRGSSKVAEPHFLESAPGWSGLMMPSVDRVGRHFPLTIARPAESLAATLAARDWFAALDRAARRALDVAFTVEHFEDTLATLARDAPAPADAASLALATRLREGGPPISLWWCGDAVVNTEFRRFAGLPPEGAFAALLGAAP